MFMKSRMTRLSNWTRYWSCKNELHRTDGPAVIYPDGKEEYWLHNIQYSSLEEIRKILIMDEALK